MKNITESCQYMERRSKNGKVTEKVEHMVADFLFTKFRREILVNVCLRVEFQNLRFGFLALGL